VDVAGVSRPAATPPCGGPAGFVRRPPPADFPTLVNIGAGRFQGLEIETAPAGEIGEIRVRKTQSETCRAQGGDVAPSVPKMELVSPDARA